LLPSAVGAELGPLPLKSCDVDEVLLDEEEEEGDATTPLARVFRLLLLPLRLLLALLLLLL